MVMTLARPAPALANAPGVTPAGSPGAAPAPAPAIPFLRATTPKLSQAFDTGPIPMLAGRQFQTFDIPPDGFLRHLWLLVTIAAAGNAAAVTFAGDAPWNALTEIVFQDQNGSEVVGPISGYNLYLTNKYLGYSWDSDPRQDPNFSMTPGAGSTGGSMTFAIRVPLEIAKRDAFCCLPNMDASSQYQLRFQVAGSTEVYGTVPTTLPTIRIQAFSELWAGIQSVNPGGVQQQQQPNGSGSTSFLSVQNLQVSNGDNTLVSKRVGNILRALILVQRDANGNRQPILTAGPAPLVMNIDNQPESRWLPQRMASEIKERYGFAGALDTAGAGDTGVYVMSDYMSQLMHPGGELRDLYRPLLTSSLLTFTGTWPNGSPVTKLDVITNDLKITSGQALYA